MTMEETEEENKKQGMYATISTEDRSDEGCAVILCKALAALKPGVQRAG